MVRDNECFICHGRADHIHHLIFGPYRKKSDYFGLVKPVCFQCHEMIHNEVDGWGLRSKQIGQLMWEMDAVMKGSTTPREDFLEEFRRSWV